MNRNLQSARAACRAKPCPPGADCGPGRAAGRTATRRPTLGVIGLAHVLAIAALATAGCVLLTAADLGPYAPLLIALGLYLALFALLVELGLLAVVVLGVLRRHQVPAPTPHRPHWARPGRRPARWAVPDTRHQEVAADAPHVA